MLMSLLLIAWAAICLLQLLRFDAAVRYLRSATRSAVNSAWLPPLTLLIPVLSEQDIIDESVAWFGSLTDALPWLSVVYITTEREPRSDRGPSTQELLLRRLGSFDRVTTLHYPYRDGVMAHQLNYGVDRVVQGSDGQVLLGIYNVDSKPSPDAIVRARAELLRDPRTVVQQYAIYPFAEPTDLASAILSHVACWQTRWSLHFELGRTLWSKTLASSGARWQPVALIVRPLLYTIGHGLFLRPDCWHELSGFPEDEINEDAFLGLQLRLAGYRVQTIPYLEAALPPPSVGAYLRQQAVWFNGPARAWHYLARLMLGSSGRHIGRMRVASPTAARAALETFKLWLPACAWAFGPWLIFLVIPALALWQGRYVALAVWFALLLWYCWGFHLLVHWVYRLLGVKTGAPGGPVAAILAYLLHGVGPVMWLAASLSGRNGQSSKYKTARAKPAGRPAL